MAPAALAEDTLIAQMSAEALGAKITAAVNAIMESMKQKKRLSPPPGTPTPPHLPLPKILHPVSSRAQMCYHVHRKTHPQGGPP